MNISKEKLKLIGGGIIVLAAASLMLQPLIVYIAGLGRMITFIITALLIAYLITVVVVRLKGKSHTSDGGNYESAAESSYEAGDTDDNGDVEV